MPTTTKPMKLTALRIADQEKRELETLARDRGVTLSDAFRQGARLFLEQPRGGGRHGP